MDKKYEKYINYIVDEIEPPYFKNMVDMYGLSPDEYELILFKVYNQPVTIKNYRVYDSMGNQIYIENSYGNWTKREFDSMGNLIYYENSNGYWAKYEYNDQGDEIYYEDSNGYWVKREYDEQGNIIYYENSSGILNDNR